MSPKQPIPSPGIPIPSPGIPTPTDVPVKCPNCGTVNRVSFEQAERGFPCSGCGQTVDGKKHGKPVPDPDNLPFQEIVCPQCRSGSNLEHLSDNAEGKRFRCKTCGIEF